MATALALWFRTAAAYSLVFLGSVCREGGDVVDALPAGETRVVTPLLVFLTLDVVGLLFSLRALRQPMAGTRLF